MRLDEAEACAALITWKMADAAGSGVTVNRLARPGFANTLEVPSDTLSGESHFINY